ncbi:MAG TPA: tripartite tricarboxylate transporter substrate binding protein [Thermodesulfobacteriota bacterium]|nr:tripartite tricarboxylate transporter substrate binding protein [Thermodesulfobacteriota bacterium]
MQRHALRTWRLLAAVLLGTAVGPAAARPAAAAYPEKPVRLVITHAAGGSTDAAARLVQPYLERHLGVPVVVQNLPGAGGNMARAYVYGQPPDGYTLLVSQQPSMSSGQIVSGGIFDVAKFVHVYNIAGHNYNCVAVRADSPFKSIEDLRRASAARPLVVAGTGTGNSYILAMLLKSKAGIAMTYVPYKTGAEGVEAVAQGQADVGTGGLDDYWPSHEQKRVRILAVAGPRRDVWHKELPTLVELGYRDIRLDQMTGVFAPPGLPDDRLRVLVAAFEKTFADKSLHTAAAEAKLSLQPMPPAEFRRASLELFRLVQELAPVLRLSQASP